MKRVVITGASGTIGTAVATALLARGDQPVALSRSPAPPGSQNGIEWQAWPDPLTETPPEAALEGADGVINLVGEPISQRWTAAAKRRIRDSRIEATRMLVAGLRLLPDDRRPKVLVSQSAAGYYGARDATELDEQASAGNDFLAGVVKSWEREAQEAEQLGRVVVTRTGLVLSPTGGALATMLPIFRAGIGGPVAGGHQYVPWVHIEDVARALLFCLDNADAAGAVNLTAPRPVENAELARALGRVLRRPAVLPVPGFALKLLYGEMSEVVTTGQRAIPRVLGQLGFDFNYAEIEPALRDVLA